MNLRDKLLLPILSVFFVAFSGFIVYQALTQRAKKEADLRSEMEVTTKLVVTTNSAYLWNMDSQGLAQSLDAFVKMQNLVSVEILDSKGISFAKASGKEARPRLLETSGDIDHEGQKIGSTKLTFTDYYVRRDLARS